MLTEHDPRGDVGATLLGRVRMPEGNIRVALLGEVAMPGEENVGRRRPGFRGAPSRSGRISPRSPPEFVVPGAG
jgi:hypothetical protein